ncbi:MAG: hypothetical protein H6728_13595 [Myxococcales bacterium]|nr:hypothetical protein [Myxococcales bacterium]MCB9644104.1 hypothetical protein [Myxococcales bacterium]
MTSRWGTWLAGLLLAVALVGCGQVPTEILESSTVLNTSDQKGPYEVKAVIIGDLRPFKINLVYSTDGWKTSNSVEMTQISAQVYQGGIPGQTAGQVIHYYIRVDDSDSNIVVEPRDVLLDKPSAEKTYSFRVLRD